ANRPSSMPTITGRSKTGLFGAILTVACTGVADMGSSLVLALFPRERAEMLGPPPRSNLDLGAGRCQPATLGNDGWRACQPIRGACSEYVDKQNEQASRQRDGRRQSQNPGHQQIAHSLPLQT